MAEKFVLHVETLFAAIDDLNSAFRSSGSKGTPPSVSLLIPVLLIYDFEHRNVTRSRSTNALQEGRQLLHAPLPHS